MGSESMRKAYIESTRKGVFGTTSVRIKPITKKEEQEVFSFKPNYIVCST
jgi:hypothetical protein